MSVSVSECEERPGSTLRFNNNNALEATDWFDSTLRFNTFVATCWIKATVNTALYNYNNKTLVATDFQKSCCLCQKVLLRYASVINGPKRCQLSLVSEWGVMCVRWQSLPQYNVCLGLLGETNYSVFVYFVFVFGVFVNCRFPVSLLWSVEGKHLHALLPLDLRLVCSTCPAKFLNSFVWSRENHPHFFTTVSFIFMQLNSSLNQEELGDQLTLPYCLDFECIDYCSQLRFHVTDHLPL